MATMPPIRHTVLRDAMMEMFGVAPNGADALEGRIKTLLALGLRRAGGTSPGRGRAHVNTLPDALDTALALTLQRAFIPPTAIAALLVRERATVEAGWSAAARGEPVTIVVEADAFGPIGRPGRRTGRFAEDVIGTLRLTSPARARPGVRLAAPPRITVDLATLYAQVTGSLRRAGAALAELHAAEAMLASTPPSPPS